MVTFRVLPERWVGQFVRKEERVFCCFESSIIGAEGRVTIVLHIHYSLWSSYWSLSANAFVFLHVETTRLQSAALTTYLLGSCTACLTCLTARSTSMTHGRVSSVRVLSVLPCAGRPPEWHSWFVISFVVYSEWDHLVHPRIDGRVILMWIFRQWEVGVWTGSSLVRIGTDGGHLWMR